MARYRMMTAMLMLTTTYGQTLRGSGDASGNLGLVFAGIFMGVIGLIGLVKWRAVWRGEYREKFERRYATFGPRWVKAILAIYPFAIIPVSLLSVWLFAVYVEANVSGVVSVAATVVGYVLFLMLFVLMILLVFIFLFNRPKLLIPPHARDFNGLFGDWIVARRERRSDGKIRRLRWEDD